MKDMNWPERVAYLENQLADSDRDNQRLRGRLAEAEREARVLVVAMADQCGASDNWKPLPDVAGMITQINNMVAGLREERALIVARAENAERALEEADERHGRYVKAVGELAGMAARIQDAQRYRWLVGQNDPIIWDYLGGMDDDQIDEAIDKWIADDAHLSRKEKQT